MKTNPGGQSETYAREVRMRPASVVGVRRQVGLASAGRSRSAGRDAGAPRDRLSKSWTQVSKVVQNKVGGVWCLV
ncbi:hypothetical protein NXS98_07630 [Fontisphaera persica]|uniref:hypothetical protein n=1 Tax=Fontisphaera persica TaxID=2974023 RepID=UPI0024BF9AB7|nr:hypothetical protein [Fontisphaera persica]WCJ60979.1 hypothetical protein NXS98_07630 [Fontisphaera persica]